ncbi:cupin-like domain-containing protein [Blastomonas sp.]|uniref:cupin-like domain-containing protein n=1 Tax=Blastomonas sp. TaxID=1909299 RepID=UPI003593B51C
MTDQPDPTGFTSTATPPVFDPDAKARFALGYPETPHRLTHALFQHPLLELEALARLGEALPEKSLEYNRGDLPIGIRPEDVPSNGLTIGETIRTIESANSWAVLKNIEQIPAYRDLLHALLAELEDVTSATTGEMLRPEGFIFVSSPGSMTPYHFDPEHNILLQLRGHKTMTVFPAGDPRFAPPEAYEAYHSGGPRNLNWSDELAAYGTDFALAPGEAIFVPVMAPHYVRNGDKPSISLSITWRSEWSFAEIDAHGFNILMRKLGLNPSPPRRYPVHNRAKSFGWRALRKLKLVG